MQKRTPQTEVVYEARAKGILDRFFCETSVIWNENPERLLEWLQDHRATLRYSTWRQYRSALAYFVQHDGRVPGLDDSIRSIQHVSGALNQATSSSKAKFIPDDSVQKVMAYLQDCREQRDISIMNWLIAGRITGLRPGEWVGASILADEDDVLILRCNNAKGTNGRSFGSHRTLIIRDLLARERDAIRDMVTSGSRLSEDAFAFELRQAGQRLSRVNRALFGALRKAKSRYGNRERGTGVTLYSARHQFAADAKAAGLSKEEIAALMGHGSIETAASHYGRRRHGVPGVFKVTPSVGDIERVRRVGALENEDDDDMAV